MDIFIKKLCVQQCSCAFSVFVSFFDILIHCLRSIDERIVLLKVLYLHLNYKLLQLNDFFATELREENGDCRQNTLKKFLI